jgi:hypothetical protein
MNDVLRVFYERKKEIDAYFELLNDFMINNAKIIFKDGTQKKISNDLAQILRANSFILIYNLSEYSISKAIESIYLDIRKKGISFDEIRDNIKKDIIANIKSSRNAEKFVEEVTNIATDILNQHPKANELFSGNVNNEEIKRLAIKYGFSHTTTARETNNGQKMDSVKKRRNHLAHGFTSFKECGQEFTIEEMNIIKKEVLLFLEEILLNIQQYIQKEEYRKA